MPCHNCGMEDGELDAFEGNSICGGCGVVLEHSPLAANIEFTKVGSRFHVVGAFVSNTEDRLPIHVLNNNKVGQGSQEMYKWNRMRSMMQEVKSMVEQVGAHYKDMEDRLRVIFRCMFGEKKASLGIRARRIYGASILLVLQEYRKGISAEDCAKIWSIPLKELMHAKKEVDMCMKEPVDLDVSDESRFVQIRASLRAALLKLEGTMYPPVHGTVSDHLEEPIYEAIIDRALEIYETSSHDGEIILTAQALAAVLHFTLCFTPELEENKQYKHLCKAASISKLSELMNVKEDEIEFEIGLLLTPPKASSAESSEDLILNIIAQSSTTDLDVEELLPSPPPKRRKISESSYVADPSPSKPSPAQKKRPKVMKKKIPRSEATL